MMKDLLWLIIIFDLENEWFSNKYLGHIIKHSNYKEIDDNWYKM